MAVPWKLIASAFGWRAGFRLEGAHPRIVIHHMRHSARLAGADEDLAASMAPVTIPSDYRPGTTQFPQWPRVVPKRAAS